MNGHSPPDKKIIFLISQPKHNIVDTPFEHPKRMFALMDEKIITFLR